MLLLDLKALELETAHRIHTHTGHKNGDQERKGGQCSGGQCSLRPSFAAPLLLRFLASQPSARRLWPVSETEKRPQTVWGRGGGGQQRLVPSL
jgi:hypothetical protein